MNLFIKNQRIWRGNLSGKMKILLKPKTFREKKKLKGKKLQRKFVGKWDMRNGRNDPPMFVGLAFSNVQMCKVFIA